MARKPDLIAYTVKTVEGREKDVWQRIGAAWKHQQGEGVNLRLDAIPLSGELVLMPPRSPEDAEG